VERRGGHRAGPYGMMMMPLLELKIRSILSFEYRL